MKATTLSRSATHYGTCQLCGSLQKAPGGYLAKHGYDVQYGFFNGVCQGSHELPYEVSSELLVSVLAATKLSIANYVAAPTPERKAQYEGNKQFVPFAEKRIAAWAPAALTAVAAVEAKEQAVKGARKGVQALSKAADLAKRALTKDLEFYRDTVEEAANTEFHAAKAAFFAANPGVVFWEGAAKAKFTTAGGSSVNTVPKLVSQLREFGFAEHADKIEALNNGYLAAKAAHEAVKA